MREETENAGRESGIAAVRKEREVEGRKPPESSVRGVVEVRMGREETRKLMVEAPQAYKTQIQEVLLTALARADGSWRGRRKLLVDVEGHGREEIGEGIDVTRTVGWFTSIYPMVIGTGEGKEEGEHLNEVKEQVRGVPRGGLGYGVLGYMGDEGVRKEIRGETEAEVSFLYLGRFDQVFSKSNGMSSVSRQQPNTESDRIHNMIIL